MNLRNVLVERRSDYRNWANKLWNTFVNNTDKSVANAMIILLKWYCISLFIYRHIICLLPEDTNCLLLWHSTDWAAFIINLLLRITTYSWFYYFLNRNVSHFNPWVRAVRWTTERSSRTRMRYIWMETRPPTKKLFINQIFAMYSQFSDWYSDFLSHPRM